ncbi:hypothetical protein R6Q59_035769 [Mikania micrantha]
MENPQNTFPCDCGAGQVVLKTVLRSKTNVGRLYYSCPNFKCKDFGCGFFRWVDESQEGENCGPGLRSGSSSSPRPSSLGLGGGSSSYRRPSSFGLQRGSSSSPGPSFSGIQRDSRSSPGPYSSGLETNCVNCKLLLAKINMLEAQLMIARRHEDSAAIQQVSDQLDGLLVEDEG